MKRSTLWITGVATAIITVVSLNALFGMQRWRYYNHYGYRHHGWHCDHEQSSREPLKRDSTAHDY